MLYAQLFDIADSFGEVNARLRANLSSHPKDYTGNLYMLIHTIDYFVNTVNYLRPAMFEERLKLLVSSGKREIYATFIIEIRKYASLVLRRMPNVFSFEDLVFLFREESERDYVTRIESGEAIRDKKILDCDKTFYELIKEHYPESNLLYLEPDVDYEDFVIYRTEKHYSCTNGDEKLDVVDCLPEKLLAMSLDQSCFEESETLVENIGRILSEIKVCVDLSDRENISSLESKYKELSIDSGVMPHLLELIPSQILFQECRNNNKTPVFIYGSSKSKTYRIVDLLDTKIKSDRLVYAIRTNSNGYFEEEFLFDKMENLHIVDNDTQNRPDLDQVQDVAERNVPNVMYFDWESPRYSK
jgi:hypothetical protein